MSITNEERNNLKTVSYITAENNERYINIMDIFHARKSYQPPLDIDDLMINYHKKYKETDPESDESNIKAALNQLKNWNCIEANTIKNNENAKTIEEFYNAKTYYRISKAGKEVHNLCITLRSLKDQDPNAAGLNFEAFKTFNAYILDIPNKKTPAEKLNHWEQILNTFKKIDDKTDAYIRIITQPQFFDEAFEDAFKFHQFKQDFSNYLQVFVNELIKSYAMFSKNINTYITQKYIDELVQLRVDDNSIKLSRKPTEEDRKIVKNQLEEEVQAIIQWFSFEYSKANNTTTRFQELKDYTSAIIQKIQKQNKKYLNDSEGFDYSKESLFLTLVQWSENFNDVTEIANMHTMLFGIEKPNHFVVSNTLNHNYYNDLADLKPSVIEVKAKDTHKKKKIQKASIVRINNEEQDKELEKIEQQDQAKIKEIFKLFNNQNEIRLDKSQHMEYALLENYTRWFFSAKTEPTNKKYIYYSNLYVNAQDIKIEVIPDFDSEYITITTEFNRIELPKLTFKLLRE